MSGNPLLRGRSRCKQVQDLARSNRTCERKALELDSSTLQCCLGVAVVRRGEQSFKKMSELSSNSTVQVAQHLGLNAGVAR